jgi:TatD DNase family protein
MILIDVGPNLAHDSFDHDRDAVLERAQAAGVRHMIVTGSSIESTRAAIELARKYPGALRATAGIHPHHAGEFSSDRRTELAALLASPEVIATGECGLDYFRNYSSHTDQERVFRLQLELAVESRKPLFLHQRDAHIPFVDILKDYLSRVSGGVAHCFTEDFAKARVYLEMGLYIGITGWLCDERRGQALRDTVQQLPLDRLVVETDAPYLLPRDLSPKPASRRNEPAFLPQVIKAIAACRKEDPNVVAEATTANARRLFGWPPLS